MLNKIASVVAAIALAIALAAGDSTNAALMVFLLVLSIFQGAGK